MAHVEASSSLPGTKFDLEEIEMVRPLAVARSVFEFLKASYPRITAPVLDLLDFSALDDQKHLRYSVSARSNKIATGARQTVFLN